MSILKKGARRIVVDGQPYYWRVRHRPTYCQSMGWSTIGLAVEAEGGQGAVLVVDVPQYHPGNWRREPAASVLPQQVADYIQQARRLGWQPLRAGKPFQLAHQTSAERTT